METTILILAVLGLGLLAPRSKAMFIIALATVLGVYAAIGYAAWSIFNQVEPVIIYSAPFQRVLSG